MPKTVKDATKLKSNTEYLRELRGAVSSNARDRIPPCTARAKGARAGMTLQKRPTWCDLDCLSCRDEIYTTCCIRLHPERFDLREYAGVEERAPK